MNAFSFRRHPGTTLIELLLFLGILSLVASLTLPILFATTENKLLQQTISIVEQNGTQVIQNVTYAVRHAERIVSPPAGQTGSYLALQTGSYDTNPTIIGVFSGSVLIIKHALQETLSTEQVGVTDFEVRNTSVSANRPSALVTFRMSRTIRLQQPHSYAQSFETLIGIPPNDVPVGADCGCGAPTCSAADSLTWQVCEDSGCAEVTTDLQCP